MACQPAAPILEGLNLHLDIDEGTLLANVILLAKTVDENGNVGISISTSPGTSWLDQLGLITAATEMTKPSFACTCEDD
ncbi:hypothetical protein AB0F88_40105 [Streptosporangium sp. NPDC023963]|uniref:hypothetical protein n=1 Tax=Streptosporangium sp. NPDC023963 TaxID=3155608 RepID=UPI00341969C9